MKDIILKITGKTLSEIPAPPSPKDEDSMEFITEGRLYNRGKTMYIQYEESELSGMSGFTTSLTITPTKVRMRRHGGNKTADTVMVFEEGRRYSGLYQTEFGSFDMEILTNSITGLFPDEDPDKLSIDYSLSLKGLVETRKKLDIEILKRS